MKKLSYKSIIEAIRTKDPKKVLCMIEVPLNTINITIAGIENVA